MSERVIHFEYLLLDLIHKKCFVVFDLLAVTICHYLWFGTAKFIRLSFTMEYLCCTTISETNVYFTILYLSC